MFDTHNGKIAIVLSFVVGAAIVATTSLSLGQTTPLYLDPTAPIPDRVEDLLSRMTLDEKIGQMTLIDWPNLSSDSHVATYHLGALLSTSGRLSTTTTW